MLITQGGRKAEYYCRGFDYELGGATSLARSLASLRLLLDRSFARSLARLLVRSRALKLSPSPSPWGARSC